jgi:hypothetical protein
MGSEVSVLDDAGVRAQLLRAWEESRPGFQEAHEEGGFVLRAADCSLAVERWPRGPQNQAGVPDHPGGRRGRLLIVATFHTHPNPAPDYQQEPSLTDIRAVRGDPDLRHPEYEGEYVISRETVYRVRPDGNVEAVGETRVLLPGAT